MSDTEESAYHSTIDDRVDGARDSRSTSEEELYTPEEQDQEFFHNERLYYNANGQHIQALGQLLSAMGIGQLRRGPHSYRPSMPAQVAAPYPQAATFHDTAPQPSERRQRPAVLASTAQRPEHDDPSSRLYSSPMNRGSSPRDSGAGLTGADAGPHSHHRSLGISNNTIHTPPSNRSGSTRSRYRAVRTDTHMTSPNHGRESSNTRPSITSSYREREEVLEDRERSRRAQYQVDAPPGLRPRSSTLGLSSPAAQQRNTPGSPLRPARDSSSTDNMSLSQLRYIVRSQRQEYLRHTGAPSISTVDANSMAQGPRIVNTRDWRTHGNYNHIHAAQRRRQWSQDLDGVGFSQLLPETEDRVRQRRIAEHREAQFHRLQQQQIRQYQENARYARMQSGDMDLTIAQARVMMQQQANRSLWPQP